MLDNLRNIGRTWFGKLLGAFLIVGLAGFGISNVIFDFGTNTVARVGDEDISTREFQRAYNADLNRVAQQIGRLPTPQEALSLGVPSGTLGRLASDSAINIMGERLELGVSEARLGKMLREDPSFAGTLGQFERQNFLRVLQQNGFTEAEYFDLQTKAARRQQLAAGFFADSAVPETAQELVSRYAGDTRTIDYFVLNEQSLLPVAEPTEAELVAYLAEHQAQFRTAETRSADLLVLSPEALAATKTITEDQIAAEYERTRQSRVKIEKRTIKQVPLATAAQQDWFERGKGAGKSFDELVAETGLTPTDIGTLGEAEITDADLAAAAFGLETGDFALIPGIGGERAVTVTAIEAGGEISLAEAHDEIAEDLALAEARREYIDILDQIEELRAAFQPIAQIAERFNLKVEKATLTAAGAELAGIANVPEAARARVAGAVFAAEQEQLAPTIMLGANHNIWFDLTSVEPARDQTLDEVRDAVAAAVTAERTDAAIKAEVGKAIAQLDSGIPFADVAGGMNQFPSLSQPMTRAGDGTAVLDQSVAAAAFAGGAGHYGSAVNGDGDHLVFQVVEITPAAAPTSAEGRTFIEDSTRNALYSDFVGGLRDEAGLRINNQTFDQLIALDAATGQ